MRFNDGANEFEIGSSASKAWQLSSKHRLSHTPGLRGNAEMIRRYGLVVGAMLSAWAAGVSPLQAQTPGQISFLACYVRMSASGSPASTTGQPFYNYKKITLDVAGPGSTAPSPTFTLQTYEDAKPGYSYGTNGSGVLFTISTSSEQIDWVARIYETYRGVYVVADYDLTPPSTYKLKSYRLSPPPESLPGCPK